MAPLTVVREVLTQKLPAFLQSLNIPENFDGFAKLTPEEIGALSGVVVALLLVLLGAVYLLPKGGSGNKRVNNMIKLNEAKVADIIPLPEAMAKAKSTDNGKVVFCRCWKSKTFPYCDGSHVKHNKETGDNVGPLVLPA